MRTSYIQLHNICLHESLVRGLPGEMQAFCIAFILGYRACHVFLLEKSHNRCLCWTGSCGTPSFWMSYMSKRLFMLKSGESFESFFKFDSFWLTFYIFCACTFESCAVLCSAGPIPQALVWRLTLLENLHKDLLRTSEIRSLTQVTMHEPETSDSSRCFQSSPCFHHFSEGQKRWKNDDLPYEKQFPRMWSWRAGLFQVCIFDWLETIWEEFWIVLNSFDVLMSTLIGCVKLCVVFDSFRFHGVPRGLRSSRARGCGCKLHVPGLGDFFWDFTVPF